MRTYLGIIGGSGLYDMLGLDTPQWTTVDSPWGTPSDAILTGTLHGQAVAFLPRHGRGHIHSPTSVPYRANIDALKRLGVTHVVSISACGSFRDHLSPACLKAGQDAGVTVHNGGTYLAMEGPQFSSIAESHLYRSWGCDVIGMTNMPEAKLAREAELHYASVAMITDYDSWHPDHGAVDVSDVIKTLRANGTKARDLVVNLCADMSALACSTDCDTALTHAIMTTPDARDPTLIAKLDAVAGRVL